MNKQRHRLVFNARRRQIMAVAETASSIKGGASGERPPEGAARTATLAHKLRHIALHPLSLSIGLALALVLVFSTSARAQIIADPTAPANQRPTVHSAANGVPLVNIQTPTAAGISRNTYRQFDVQTNGVILNNGRESSYTQLGGWVAANPWLAAGTARIIVNEVNSSNPSLLHGFVEVAGQRAQVIIANPAGIQVRGGGFINARQATLTTGKPVFENEALESFRVHGGTITIDGAGLDTSSTDYTAILARAVEANAGIWAQELKVVTGVNDVSADMGTVNATPANATGSAPAYALDVAQLGGMYAGKIHLVGTEAGVGVSLRGVVGATSGDVVIDASGRLHHQGTLQASGQVRLQVQDDVRMEGDVYAGAGLSVATPHTLHNSAELRAQGDIDIQAGRVQNEPGARIVSAATLSVTSQGAVDNAGQLYAANNLALNAEGTVNNSGLIAAGGHANLQGQAITNTGSVAAGLNTDGTLKAEVANLIVQADEQLTVTGEQLASGDVSLRAQAVNHAAGQTQAQRDIAIEADVLDNTQGSVVAGRDLGITSGQSVINHQGLLSAGASLTLADAAVSADPQAQRTLNIGNTDGTMIANDHLGIDAASLGLDGKLLSRNNMSLKLVGDHHISQEGEVIANSDLDITLDGGGDLTNDGALQAGRVLQANARHITNNATGVISAESTRLRALQNLVNRGLIDGATTDVRAQNLTNTGTGRIYGQDVRLQAQANLINEGNAVVAAHESLHIGVGGELTNRDGATLLSLGELAVGGALDADGKATGAAQAIHNRSATIESVGDMRLSADELNNVNDQLAYTVVPEGTTSRTDYYTTQGYVGSEEVAWMGPMTLRYLDQYFYLPVREAVLLKTSAYADPIYRSFLLGPSPYVPAHERTIREGTSPDTYYTIWVESAFNYDRHSPIWEMFGMVAPTWNPPQGAAESSPKAAPWLELQRRVKEFKQDIGSQFLNFDIYRNYTETLHTAEVTASQPASILSGANLHLQVPGTALNKDSSIVAGGNIQVQGSSVTNQTTEVSTPTQRSGTVSNWAVIGEDCDFFFGCDPIMGWATAPYAETINRTVSLASVRYEQNTQPPAISQQPGALQTGHTTAKASGVTAPTGQAGAPNLTLPSGALYQLHPDTTASYLVETDPRFTDKRQWLSSDHMLAAMSVDPATAQKRIGDGNYEQRLVREQVTTLTGHRFLGDFTSDEQQYLALMNAGATFAQAHQLRPGIELSAAQVAALTSDIVWLVERTVSLPDGSTTQALVPQLYVHPQAGDLQPSGALLAGKSVNLDLSEDLTNASGTIAGRQVTQINAANVHNLGGLITSGQVTTVTAAQDIRNVGGTIGAQDALALDAGRDLSVQTTSTQGSGHTGVGVYSSQGIDRVAALYVSNPNGVLLASAGQDLNLTAALVQSEGGVQLQAGRDIALDTVQTRTDIAVKRDSRNYAGVRLGEEVGTRITSEGSTSLLAGQDIQARAAQVQAQGQLGLQAGRDVQIEAGEHSLSTDNASYAKGSSFLSSGSTEIREHRSETNAVASNLGGEQVTLQSGQDTNVIGSSVIGDGGTTVQAGRDISLNSAQTARSESRFEENKSSGLNFDGGINIGSQQQSTDQQTQGTGAAGSTVGAIRGDVNLTAGQTYRQTGSDVLAPTGDINVQAQAIEITEARITEQSHLEEKSKQSGLSIGAGGGILGAMQGIAQTLDAIEETGDTRTKALGAAAAALQAKSAVDSVQKALADGAGAFDASGVSINISIGSSSSQSTSQSQSSKAQGSTLQAGGDVNLVARNSSVQPEPVEGPGPGDILIRGSEISAGGTARLSADGDIDLVSAQNTTEQSHQSSSKSGSLGVGIGANGVSFNASASKSKGKGNGHETTHTNTRIEAGEQVQLESGQDTTLQGAVVAAAQVQAQVGGDLKIESVQDQATYKESSESSGFSVSLCIPPICYGASSASVSSGSTRIDSNYQSVNEQSAIRAGDGGFQVNVDGATELMGGAITSTQAAIDNQRNEFKSEGGLSTSDIQNRADYEADGSSFGISVSGKLGDQSTASTPAEKRAANAPAGPGGSAGMGQDSGSASSVTQAAISGIAGNTEARTGDAETGIAPIFDQERVKAEVNAQITITAEFGKQASKAVGDYATRQLQQASGLREQASAEPDAERRAELNAQADQLESNWGDSGALRLLAHTTIGALTGGTAGAAGAAAGTLSAPVVANALREAGIEGQLADLITTTASTAVGAGVGGTAGATAAFNEVQNNFLTHAEASRRLKLQGEVLACNDDACRQDKQAEMDRLNRLDVWRDQQIEQACNSPASAACQSWTAAIQVAAKSHEGQLGNFVDTAERASVQNQAFKYQQATNNPFLHGVGKGLLKLTPPGLAVGALGGVTMAVQAIAENGLSQTLIDSVNAIAGMPADLKARLNSPDPTVRGEALVDVITLGSGAAAVVAGGTKVTINAVQRAQVAKVVAEAEAKAVALARVENNATADMPGYSAVAQRDFKPGTTHRAENVNAGQVTDRDGLPRIDEANTRNNDQIKEMLGGNTPEWWGTQRPAWKDGTVVVDRIVTQPEVYRMVVNEKQAKDIAQALELGKPAEAARNLGGWATKDVIGNVKDVREKLAISSEWKGQGGQSIYVVEIEVLPGVGVREGVVGPMFDNNIKSELAGGGHQVLFLGNSPFVAPELYVINPANIRKLHE
ncbi:MAG: hemagglutinin repeat-containing protein [Hydrogenophaga sp.]|uniref:hemagglutinin repeat-containing protein n=1 Tax=Hydrogenophaga sp. TaxID=1904254 RepID=UPI003D127302